MRRQLIQQSVETTVEEIVQVSRIEHQEEIVERQVELVVSILRTVEVPRVRERVVMRLSAG